MIVAPRSSSARVALSAAGFIATSTFGVSPGVRMSREAKWIWNADTPASVPAGARISAGKFGSVARSLPTTAVASVKRPPASCIPSPESPAKRTMTRSRSSTTLLTRSFPCAPTPPDTGTTVVTYRLYARARTWWRLLRAYDGFLTACSWSGASRDAGAVMVPPASADRRGRGPWAARRLARIVAVEVPVADYVRRAGAVLLVDGHAEPGNRSLSSLVVAVHQIDHQPGPVFCGAAQELVGLVGAIADRAPPQAVV